MDWKVIGVQGAIARGALRVEARTREVPAGTPNEMANEVKWEV